jgi:serine/threonine-protein kinase HipA
MARQGALRLCKNLNGPYLKENTDSSIPPLIKLPKLLSATEKFFYRFQR